MEFTYKKHDNSKLFLSLEKTGLGLKNIQNYIPLYNNFFALTDANWNNMNLNNKLYLYSIKDKETDNIVNGTLKDITGNSKLKKPVFFKYSPLLDPLKYIIGKYDIEDKNLLNLPSFTNQNNFHEKLKDVNNSAYVDSFFSYLTSTLLHSHSFLHGLDFYGSFLSIKEKYPVNIYDDIEYVDEFDFFHKNKDILFSVDESYTDMVGNDTRNYKQKINVFNEQVDLQLSDISEIHSKLEINKEITPTIDVIEVTHDTKPDIIYENLIHKKSASTSKSSSSSCSSRSSNSSIGEKCDEINECDLSESEEEDELDLKDEHDFKDEHDLKDHNDSDSDGYSSIDGEEVIVKIKEFPVQIIALECCEDTLNSLIEDDEHPLNDEEWESIIMQVLMSLITYQNVFGLTHNDLHANNIMYTNTDKQFIYYKVDSTYYKVPTFGKLFKIIDFGRAIYKFKGQLLCSDSFHPKGDAATQYNFPPYFNSKKPLVEPNFSFDLCRLGCSIYDYIVDDVSEESTVTSPIMKIIMEWCKDDKGRNILYKKNGDERYPDFKLYKMISRKVHSHVPINVLRNSHFDKFKVTKKKIPKEKNIINIDEIPSYM
jgi:hypothetical protein